MRILRKKEKKRGIIKYTWKEIYNGNESYLHDKSPSTEIFMNKGGNHINVGSSFNVFALGRLMFFLRNLGMMRKKWRNRCKLNKNIFVCVDQKNGKKNEFSIIFFGLIYDLNKKHFLYNTAYQWIYAKSDLTWRLLFNRCY